VDDDGGEAWPASALWDYAVALYAVPGVAPACLALQDRRGADVNLLLLACWLGATGRDPGAQRLAAARERGEAWQEELVRPLRQARRLLKDVLPTLAGPLRSRLAMTRTDLAAAELALERGELLLLEQLSEAAPVGAARGGSALAARIMRHLVALDPEADPELQALLAAAFPGCDGEGELRRAP
jgi:uncharacterized protein (TIGR02444 family)